MNPYEKEFLRTGSTRDDLERYSSRFMLRDELVRTYAWAIPNDAAIEYLVNLGPILEVGAGRGYWAHLIQQAGGDIVAYDLTPPEKTWTEVRKGGRAETSLPEHQHRTLMLCWPPYKTRMALEHVQAYSGPRVVYIGEWQGCTADESFHGYLEANFKEARTLNIPKWDGLHDFLSVWER